MKGLESAFLAVCVAASMAQGADRSTPWPVFRGRPALTGLASGHLSSNLTLRWSFETGGRVRSSPVVGYGRVFFGSKDKKVYSLDWADGSPAWSFDAGDVIEAPPLLHDGTVYVGTLGGTFLALDAEGGREKWRLETGGQIVGGANRLDVAGRDVIVVGSHDNCLYALEADSGRKVWTRPFDSFINGTPAIGGGRIVVGGCDAMIHLLSGENGAGPAIDAGSYIAGSAAYSDGRVYVGHYGNLLLCLDVKKEAIRWEFGSEESGAPFFSSPAVDARRVVAGSRDRKVYCVDKRTGREIWRFATRGPVDGSPVICDGKVIVGSEDGMLYMLDLATGVAVWSYEVGRPIATSPAVADGRVAVGADDGRVYVFWGGED